jgi:LmbE family N-acetylglucosaminyl deacetylase
VVIFDSSLPGTDADLWLGDDRAGALPALGLDGVEHVVVVAAHPDDETLGAGGLIAECGLRGIPVTVAVVTDGGASHPDSPSTTPDELRRLRAAEARLAVHRLAPEAGIHLLGFPDGAVETNRTAIATALAELLPAGPALLVAPWRGDEHVDHRVVGEICAELATANGRSLLEYPIWLWHWAAPDDAEVPWDRFTVLAPRPEALDHKSNAIAAYASQAEPLSDQPGDEAMLLDSFLANFRGTRELFVRDEPAALGVDYFDALYERHDDPWGFTDRWYEKRKRAVTLASLPEEHYVSALEVGCSIGVLTKELAGRCTELLAVDLSLAAVESARARVADEPGVRVEVADIASGLPSGPFDLVVVSEVGYYFTTDVLERVLADAVAQLAAGGTIALCHWRHPVADYALGGDEVHEVAARVLSGSMTRLARHDETDFALEVYSADPRSVAARTGLL